MASQPASVQRVHSFVLAVLGHLHQLIDGVQQAVAVLPQQLLVEPLVSEAHLQQHGHHGRVLPGGRVNASLERTAKQDESEVRGGTPEVGNLIEFCTALLIPTDF